MRAVERGDMIGPGQVGFIDEIDVVIDLGRLFEDRPGRPALLFLTRPLLEIEIGPFAVNRLQEDQRNGGRRGPGFEKASTTIASQALSPMIWAKDCWSFEFPETPRLMNCSPVLRCMIIG